MTSTITVPTIAASTAYSTSYSNVWVGNTTGNTTTSPLFYSGTSGYITSSPVLYTNGVTSLKSGTYDLEDGAKLIIDDKGNYRIEDKNAKITYKSNNVREFNKYINSSDLLADFIADMGKMGADARQVLEIPIQYFIRWLICKSAEQDGEDSTETVPVIANDTVKVLELKQNRCKCCGRYISQLNLSHGLLFCNGRHADKFLERVKKGLRSCQMEDVKI